MKSKNGKGLFIVLILILTLVVGTTFALWQLTLTQKKTNIINTDSFKVTFVDEDPISIQNAYPITDEEGKKLSPYKFTLTNMCSSIAVYDINLEMLKTNTLEDIDYIKILLNESTKQEEPKSLTSNNLVEKTLDKASSSHKIGTGYLNENESKSFEVRL